MNYKSCCLSCSSYTSSAKRPRMDLVHKKEFEQKVASLSEWLDKTEMNLELLTAEPTDPQDALTLEEQMVLVKVSSMFLRII